MSDASTDNPPLIFPIAPRPTAYESPTIVEYRGTRTAFASPADLARHVREADKIAAAQKDLAATRQRQFDWLMAPTAARLQFALVDLIFGAVGARVGVALMVVAIPLLILALVPARVTGG